MKEAKLQLGKSGVTEGFIQSLTNALSTHERARITVLKNASHDRLKVNQMAKEITEKLTKTYAYKIIGFTIILIKTKKPKP
jgi:RNA-binding protein YhbY